MSSERPWRHAALHAHASQAFRDLPAEKVRERLRQAGVLGVTPRIGDKVRVLGRLDLWHYGIVVGATPDGRIHVVHNDKIRGVTLDALDSFAGGQRVQLVQRAPSGQEFEVAQRAMSLRGRPYDLLNFNCEHLVNYAHGSAPHSPQVAWAATAGMLGLATLAAVALSSDRQWDESSARYRDARGRPR